MVVISTASSQNEEPVPLTAEDLHQIRNLSKDVSTVVARHNVAGQNVAGCRLVHECRRCVAQVYDVTLFDVVLFAVILFDVTLFAIVLLYFKLLCVTLLAVALLDVTLFAVTLFDVTLFAVANLKLGIES